MIAFAVIIGVWIVFRWYLWHLPFNAAAPVSVGENLAAAISPVRAVVKPGVGPGIVPKADSKLQLDLPAFTMPRPPLVIAADRILEHSAARKAPAPAVLRAPALAKSLAEPQFASPGAALVHGARAEQARHLRRWSGDLWIALREGSGGPAFAGSALPAYGGSQAGAVLRFDLAPSSRGHPSAYVRVVQALSGMRDGDLAVGLAVRPMAHVPLTAHAEVRASRRDGGLEARPAAFVTTGLDDVRIAGAISARGYAQAGYVGGRGATLFADGSFVAEHALWHEGASELAAGVGTWGGAQRGAARLDLGPTASLKFPLGEGTGRLAVDYRLRVAGNAEPSMGAALTLSAGF